METNDGKPLALVIEDDTLLGGVFVTALNSVGFATEHIADGAAAQTRLTGLAPDIIVLDLHLPHVSGEDLLKQVRADPRLANLPVIVATADALMAEYLAVKPDLVLLKPISPIQLRELAKRLFPGG